jgi:hypothetical protein
MPNIFGLVRAIRSRDPRHTAPPFVVEIYSPIAPLGEQTKSFNLEEVRDNRELVLVSVLRDALIHELPVELGYDEQSKQIDHVEIRTSWAEAFLDILLKHFVVHGAELVKKGGSIEGKVITISVDESGMGEVIISPKEEDKAKEPLWLHLDLQKPDKEVKMAQLSLLRHAYEDGTDVIVVYENVGNRQRIVRVIVGQTVFGVGKAGPVPTPP